MHFTPTVATEERMTAGPRWIRRCACALAAAACLAAGASGAGAQSTLETTLRQYNAETVRGYIQPLADLFSVDMSSGFYQSASIGRRWAFSFELVGMAAAIEDEHRTYVARTPDGFEPQTFETATVFGGEGTLVNSTNSPGLSYRGSDGFIDADYLPAAAPQIRMSLFGTEAIVRYLSSSLSSLPEEDFPETTLLSIGGRHNISQYLPMLPLDVSVGAFWSSLEMGDIVEFTGLSYGVQASKALSLLTLYGGLATDDGTMKLTYTPSDPSETEPISVDIEAEGGVRVTGGALLRLGPLQLFGDATFGPATAYAAGLRIGH
jgi:hypothetical protein